MGIPENGQLGKERLQNLILRSEGQLGKERLQNLLFHVRAL